MILDRTIGNLQARSVEAEQAALYDGTAVLLSGQYDAGKRKIDAVQETLLPQRDRELLRTVRDMTERIRGWPNDVPQPGGVVSGDGVDKSTAAALIASAEKTLASTDEFLRPAVH